MYNSPITIHTFNQIDVEFNKALDNEICNAVKKVGVHADKDELVKALQYDRRQYDAGYYDGYRDAFKELTEEIDKMTIHILDDEYMIWKSMFDKLVREWWD